MENLIESYQGKIVSNLHRIFYVRHNTYPFLNRTSAPALERKPEISQYLVGHPVPYIYDISKKADLKDIVVQSVKEKFCWHTKLERLQKGYKKSE